MTKCTCCAKWKWHFVACAGDRRPEAQRGSDLCEWRDINKRGEVKDTTLVLHLILCSVRAAVGPSVETGAFGGEDTERSQSQMFGVSRRSISNYDDFLLCDFIDMPHCKKYFYWQDKARFKFVCLPDVTQKNSNNQFHHVVFKRTTAPLSAAFIFVSVRSTFYDTTWQC